MGESAHRKTAPASQPGPFPQAVKRSTAGAGKQWESSCHLPVPGRGRNSFPARQRARKILINISIRVGPSLELGSLDRKVATLAGEGVAREPLAPGHPGSTHVSCLLWGESGLGPTGGQQRQGRQASLSGGHPSNHIPPQVTQQQRTSSVTDPASRELLDSLMK